MTTLGIVIAGAIVALPWLYAAARMISRGVLRSIDERSKSEQA